MSTANWYSRPLTPLIIILLLLCMIFLLQSEDEYILTVKRTDKYRPVLVEYLPAQIHEKITEGKSFISSSSYHDVTERLVSELRMKLRNISVSKTIYSIYPLTKVGAYYCWRNWYFIFFWDSRNLICVNGRWFRDPWCLGVVDRFRSFHGWRRNGYVD